MILGERFQDVLGCAYPKFPHRLYVFLLLIIYTKYHVQMSNNPFILEYPHFRKKYSCLGKWTVFSENHLISPLI